MIDAAELAVVEEVVEEVQRPQMVRVLVAAEHTSIEDQAGLLKLATGTVLEVVVVELH